MIGLLGKTLSHSLSKPLHQALGTDAYQLFETDDLATFIHRTAFKALNVTIPYKRDMVSFCTSRDEVVEATGVTNTVVRMHDGTLRAYNTDYDALKTLIDWHAPKDRSLPAAIIGNGSTARTAQYALERAGYTDIRLYARQPLPGERSLDQIAEIRQAGLLIQATPVGTSPDLETRFELDLKGSRLQWVLDVVYNPPLTRLVQEARDAGITAHNGLTMLILQALHAHGHFMNTPPPLERLAPLHAHLLKYLANIVLIGPPFSGKSTLAPRLAERFGKHPIDTDSLIESKSGMRVADIFSRLGEVTFRSMEKYQTMTVAAQGRQIIATGGGAVLQEPLMRALQRTGVLVHIDPDLGLVRDMPLKNRPLITSWADYETLRTARDPLYARYADVRIHKTSLDLAAILDEIEVKLDAYFRNQWTELESPRTP
ncbi:MAG: shikimate kinase [Acholeplasmatales bacterium]|nr:MAG: shikimate kinase [Acholeplasmatales bacterium]